MEKRIVTWETGDGRKVVFEISLKTEKDINAHGFTKPCCEIEESVTVAGVVMDGYFDRCTAPSIVASYGRLGITKINYDRIQAATKDLKTTEYYTEWQAKIAAANEDVDKYHASTAAIKKMMEE